MKKDKIDIIAIERIVEIVMNYQLSFNTTFHDFNQTFHNLFCSSKILLQKTYQIKFKIKFFEQFEQFKSEIRYSRKIYIEAIFLLAFFIVIVRI